MKRLLAANKNIKLGLHTSNSNMYYKTVYLAYQRCYHVIKTTYGNPKSLNLSLINLAYRYKPIKKQNFSKFLKLERHLQR